MLFRPQGNTTAQCLPWVLKTKGSYLWVLGRFVGCASADLTDEQDFGVLGGLAAEGLGERKDKLACQTLPESMNVGCLQETTLPSDTARPYSFSSVCANLWFQRYHMVAKKHYDILNNSYSSWMCSHY
jgi:hypothetical protein